MKRRKMTRHLIMGIATAIDFGGLFFSFFFPFFRFRTLSGGFISHLGLGFLRFSSIYYHNYYSEAPSF